LDSILAGEKPLPLPERSLSGLRLGVPTRGWTEQLDHGVAHAYGRALRRLSAAGAQLVDVDFAAIDLLEQVDRLGGLAGPEAFAVHRTLLQSKGNLYDPRVRSRIESSSGVLAADYIDAMRVRSLAIESFDKDTVALDAVITPTVAVVPPRFEELEQEEDYRRFNAAIRRLVAPANLLDRCAISLPCHSPGELPVGLMLTGERNGDAALLAIAAAVEKTLRLATDSST
jgi:aspartyl-tRNA(Asn)/glutamyl-tRNA(Gln) amidotransferase subunit A